MGLGDFFPLLSTPTCETSTSAWVNFTLVLHSAPLSAALHQLSFSCVKEQTQTPALSWNASCATPSREDLDWFFSLHPKLQTSDDPQYCKTWGEDRFTCQAAVWVSLPHWKDAFNWQHRAPTARAASLHHQILTQPLSLYQVIWTMETSSQENSGKCWHKGEEKKKEKAFSWGT